MNSLTLPVGKKIANSIKAGCRFLCRPLQPVLPDAVANRLPFLGQVCVRGPGQWRLRFHTYGPGGKDRIAIRLGRYGLWSYEGETTRIFLPLVARANTVIDIGANTGFFALLAAIANPGCKVWAFEPVPFIHEMLLQNLRLNGLSNLESVPMAVADFTGETPFFVTRTSGGIPLDSSACSGFRERVEEFRLPTITLDEYVEKKQLPKLDLVKIDAEATEIKVIRGALRTLRQHRPLVICEVLENVNQDGLEQMLGVLGYRFYHISPAGLERRPHLHGSLAKDQRNHLFVPAEKEIQVIQICAGEGIQVNGVEEGAPLR